MPQPQLDGENTDGRRIGAGELITRHRSRQSTPWPGTLVVLRCAPT